MGFYLEQADGITTLGRVLKKHDLPDNFSFTNSSGIINSITLDEPVRVILKQKTREDYFKLIKNLNENEVLVGYFDRGFERNSVWVVDFDDYMWLEDLIEKGAMWRLGYYALNKELTPKFWRLDGRKSTKFI